MAGSYEHTEIIEDFKLEWTIFPNDTVAYKITDNSIHESEELIVPLENFSTALAVYRYGDDVVTSKEYEKAEAALGTKIRWIP